MPRSHVTIPGPYLHTGDERGNLRLPHAGKWVAWSLDETRIVGACETAENVRAAARLAGHDRLIYDWIPPLSANLGNHRGDDAWTPHSSRM